MKRFLLVALLIVGVLMVSAGVAGAQDAKLKFIMIAHGSPAGNPFWSTVEKGMVDACALLDADCQWLGDPNYSAEAMSAYWEDALAAQPTALEQQLLTQMQSVQVLNRRMPRAFRSSSSILLTRALEPIRR